MAINTLDRRTGAKKAAPVGQRVSPGVYRDPKTGGLLTPTQKAKAPAQAPKKAPKKGNKPPKPTKRYQQEVEAEKYARQQEAGATPTYVSPTGTVGTKVDEQGNIINETTLSAPQQQILEKGEALSQAGLSKAQEGLNSFAPKTGGFEKINPQAQMYQGENSDVYNVGGALGKAAQGVQSYKSFAYGDPEQERARVEDAVFSRLTRGMDRDYAKEKADIEQNLINRGVPLDPTNPLYKNYMTSLDEKYGAMRDSARGQAVQMGGEEMSRNYGQSLSQHQQGLSDIGALQGFGMQGYGQRQTDIQSQFQQGLQSQGQEMAGRTQQLNEIGQMQGLGTGLMMPNSPVYQPTPFNPANQSELNLAYAQLNKNRGGRGPGDGRVNPNNQPQPTDPNDIYM